MRLLAFELNDWRNIASVRVEPQPGINVFYGDNAQGKTNLIEGIYYVATLRSFRSSRVSQLTRWGAEGFHLRARADVEGRVVSFEVHQHGGTRRLVVDGAVVDTTDDYFGGFNVVLFTPEHLSLVRGEPAGRRSFVDRALFNVDPTQLATVRRYNRVLRERNALLRQHLSGGRLDPALLDVLDQQLATAGAAVVGRRRWLLEELSPLVQGVHAELAGPHKPLQLAYRVRGRTAEEADAEGQDEEALCHGLEEALRDRRSNDLRRGFTSVGPHQDDLLLLLDGRPARHVASQGETRSIVLALKLAEVIWIHDRRSEPPVLLLDDMGSELDEKRRQVLFDYIFRMACQTFVTTVSPAWARQQGKDDYFRIVEGELIPSE